MLDLKVFLNMKIEVTPHRTLNGSKGVVRLPDFRHISEADIVEGLAPYNVTAAHRITIKMDGKDILTTLLYLHLDRPRSLLKSEPDILK